MITPMTPERYEQAHWQVQRILDDALGEHVTDGTGAGVVADVGLLAQRYDALRTAVTRLLPEAGRRLVADIEGQPLLVRPS